MTRSTEHERDVAGDVGAAEDAARRVASCNPDQRLLDVERTVRRALVARNGLEAGCEAAAEAMAWAIEHRDRLDSIEHLAAYLYRVGQSSLRRQRRWQRQPPVRFDAESVAASMSTSMSTSMPMSVPDPPFDADLFGALARLGHEQRVAVVMVHVYGHRYREVATLLGVSEAAVTNHVHRGLARLRTLLGDPS